MTISRRARLGFACVATMASASGTAAAEAAPAARAGIEGDMLDYYEGERLSGRTAAALGFAATGAGAFLLTRNGDFAQGLGWPLLGLGALEAIGGISYAFTVGGEIRRYSELLARDPAAFKREELAHIHGTTSRFIYYRITEVALAVGGAAVATYGFATDHDAWAGAGIGMAAIALPIVVMDTVNNGRAGAYEEAVGRFRPTLALYPSGAPGGWAASLGGRF